eukprot:gene10104-12393_t
MENNNPPEVHEHHHHHNVIDNNNPPEVQEHHHHHNVIDNNNPPEVAHDNANVRRRGRFLVSPLAFALFLISFLLVAHGVTQIVISTVKDGLDVSDAWAFMVNGLLCVLLGLLGFLVALIHRPILLKLFTLLAFFTFIEAVVLFIIYSALVHGYIRDDCGGDFGWNPYCQDLEVYLGVSLGIFWSFNIFLLVSYFYF